LGTGNHQQISPEELQLGALAASGGPTMTHLPHEDSCAVDNGSDLLCPTTDQRGLPRPAGDGCEMGSVELPSCGGATFIHLTEQTIDSSESFTACFTILLGPNLIFGSFADVTLTAGEVVVFDNGVSVEESAELQVGNDDLQSAPEIQDLIRLTGTAVKLRWADDGP